MDVSPYGFIDVEVTFSDEVHKLIKNLFYIDCPRLVRDMVAGDRGVGRIGVH